MKLTCKLHNIADALRKANGSKAKYNANNFHNEIGKLCHIADDINGHIPTYEGTVLKPTKKPITIKGNQYIKDDLVIRSDQTFARQFVSHEVLNEYYGCHVADVARSYHLARVNGVAKFRYSQNKGIWTGSQLLTDEEGRCYLDCSGFAGLVLRGIEFKDTPYYMAKGQPNKYLSDYGLDRTHIVELTKKSKHKWANKYLDMQTDSTLNNIGVCGKYSIRNASQQAEYYYSHGKVIHEFDKSPTAIPPNLKPGDLLFWAKETASDIQKERYRSISHVAIVARDTSRYYQVTGFSDERVTDTVFYSALKDHLDELVLVIRPNYIPMVEEAPKGMNLLNDYLYDSCITNATTTLKGVEISPLVEGGFNINRVEANSSGFSFYIVERDTPLRLPKGTYKLSGAPRLAETSQAARDWGLMIRTTDGSTIIGGSGNEVIDKGDGDTFTLTKETKVYVYFYGSGTLSPSNLICVPRLERMS